MSNELNWFHVRRWTHNRRVRQMHEFEKTKQAPKDTEQQILRMLSEGNVTITRSESKEEDEEKKKDEKRK